MLIHAAAARPWPVRPLSMLSKGSLGAFSHAWFACSLTVALATGAMAGPDDTVWTRLFNGTDFKDWDIKTMGLALNQDPKNTYRIVDGAIEVNYSNYANWNGEPWSHIGYKVRPFSYYLVRLEYQFFGKQVPGAPGYANENSGLMIHSQSLASMALNQNWPISLEVQYLGPNSDQGVGSANLCTPGTAVELPKGTFNDSHCIQASANTRTLAPAWVRTSALVLGDSLVRHYIEGKSVLTYYKPMTQQGIVSGNSVPIVNKKPLGTGYILLQSESAPIRFRNIELANLEGCKDPSSPRYKSYYVRNLASDCVVTGLRETSGRESFRIAGMRLIVEQAGPHKVQLLDRLGRLLWSGSGDGKAEHDLQGLPPGLAILAVSYPGGTWARTVLLAP